MKEQKSWKDLADSICEGDINNGEILKQAIADHSLDDELIKLLPKEFCEKQGYYKSIGASMTKYPNTDKEEQWVRIK